MKVFFVVLFIVLYVLANELTYMIAVHQQMGLCRHIWAGSFCWINRIFIAIPCVWYCGWIVGFVLIAFALFGLLHATIGWVLNIPTLNINDEATVIKQTNLECAFLLPMNILCLVFLVLSFFLVPFKSAIQVLGSTTNIIIIAAILVVGFLVRLIVLHKISD